MKKVRIGLPDGNGCFGTLEFWKQYFSDIGVEYVGVDDEEYKLEQYVRESNSIFPSSICVNSKGQEFLIMRLLSRGYCNGFLILFVLVMRMYWLNKVA